MHNDLAALPEPTGRQPPADVELLRLVAMSTNDGIWDWDLASSRVYYSDRWLELVGADVGDAPMHIDTFLNRLHDEDRPRVQQQIEGYLSGSAPEYRIEFRLRHHDNSWRWILSRGALVRDAAGHPVRLAGTHTDITDRVMEAERLEKLVAERTVELQVARDRAESNAAATAKFLAATSHDVSQPLQAAALLIGSLHQEVATASARSMLQAVERSLAACMELLESLLEFSRLDAGALRPHLGRVDAGELLESVAASFAAEAMRRRIRLHVVPPHVQVTTDPRLFNRILRNLVSNALKYTERGTVLIGARRRGTSLRIEVWDTGRGVPATQLSHIFREFVRLPDGRESYAPGLGLGLAIVERLAKLMGHTVAVRSWPGRGSVFSVEVACAAAMGAESGEVSAVGPLGTTSLPPRRVALLEDNADIADGLQRMLAGFGWKVWHGATLPVLLQRLGDVVPDFVIADWHIDGPMDGFASYDELERRFGPLQGLVLTGHYDTAELTVANRALRKVLFKPIAPAVLHAVLRGIVAPQAE